MTQRFMAQTNTDVNKITQKQPKYCPLDQFLNDI